MHPQTLSDLYSAHPHYAAAFLFSYGMAMLTGGVVSIEYANLVLG